MNKCAFYSVKQDCLFACLCLFFLPQRGWCWPHGVIAHGELTEERRLAGRRWATFHSLLFPKQISFHPPSSPSPTSLDRVPDSHTSAFPRSSWGPPVVWLFPYRSNSSGHPIVDKTTSGGSWYCYFSPSGSCTARKLKIPFFPYFSLPELQIFSISLGPGRPCVLNFLQHT